MTQACGCCGKFTAVEGLRYGDDVDLCEACAKDTTLQMIRVQLGTVPTPRYVLKWFACRREERLAANDHKGGWSESGSVWLRNRALEELDELFQAMCSEDATPEKVIAECADAANFCMMIADNWQRMCQQQQIRESERC